MHSVSTFLLVVSLAVVNPLQADGQLGHRIVSKSVPWTYAEPDRWGSLFTPCSGMHQSPIVLDQRSSIRKSFPKLHFHGYDQLIPLILTNDGHSARLHLAPEYQHKRPYINGGGLTDRYEFVQLHFHWGSRSGQGSEHRYVRHSFSGELHLVHYNTKYRSVDEAKKHADGLAVLAVFLQVAPYDNLALDSIIARLEKIKVPNSPVQLRTFRRLWSFLPANTISFYRYGGSLTTPPCREVVSWIVFTTPVVVSEHQLKMFRMLRDKAGHHLLNTFRPVQHVAGRKVFLTEIPK